TLAAARILGIKGIGYEKFPRKNVIKQRILEETFVEQPQILIPHMELTIEILANLLENVDFNFIQSIFKFTKKEKTNIQILADILTQKNITLPVIQKYLAKCDETKEKSNLKKFLKE
ncbi:MAG: hypothetical protein ACXAC7_21035, partial [Candidatus Hodarchaeales archaeon]